VNFSYLQPALPPCLKANARLTYLLEVRDAKVRN